MFDWFSVVVLSVVEGVTEFLPVSSTGHMILVSEWLHIEKTPQFEAFLVIVQSGAILALVSVFWKRFLVWFYSWYVSLFSFIFLNSKKNFEKFTIEKNYNSRQKTTFSLRKHVFFNEITEKWNAITLNSCDQTNFWEMNHKIQWITVFFARFFLKSLSFLLLQSENKVTFQKKSFFQREIYMNAPQQEAFFVFCATIPAFAVGFLLKNFIHTLFSVRTVAFALIVGGVVIFFLEKFLKGAQKSAEELRLSTAITIGLGQCCALWPGFSRSAATILSARCLGFSRTAAAEISFLIGFPTLLGASGYEFLKTYHVIESHFLLQLTVGILISWVTAFYCVKGFWEFLRNYSLVGFAYYRILLGLFLLYWQF